MNIKTILTTTYQILSGWRKANLVAAVVKLRDKYLRLQDRVRQLEQENTQLKEQLEREKIKETNKQVNKPSSKQAEWEKDSRTGKDKGKKKPKGRKRKGRKGAGNRPKNQVPNREETATVDTCDLCGKDLSAQDPLESTNERIIEDIVAPPEETIVTLVTQQKKYCADCKEVITAKSDLALPGADMGLNATVLVCYLWVALCLPYPKIREYLGTFFKLSVSTSGLSRHVIKVAGIMRDVHAEILNGIQNGAVLHADETGWRVRGKNWWLWVFGTPDTAYFTVDKTRGSKVVRRVLGEIFFGVLVVDGWNAYLYLLCEQQSCLSHLLRKVRKFRDAFPHLTDIVKFYLKFRRIIRDGERLQHNRDQLGELVFQRRLKRLKQRLADLVQWLNPGDVLEEIIKKVKRQQPRILTFVEHPDVPFHNNYAEYLIRIGVLKRKISGGSVSAEGAASYAILLSIYTTCKLRGMSFPKYLKESLKHYIKTGAPLSLKAFQDATAAVPEVKKAA
ncbi:MAG: IS66 family transposase [Desulfosarcina sp.]|nr:IS66 family transposase [Desulfosarcina sp.]MBC2766732.1 IS66 family transposase [Desulfosarcina sp.]